MIDNWLKIPVTWTGVRLVLISVTSYRPDMMALTSISAGSELRSKAVRSRLLRL